jgi:hypothetical protein
MTTINFINSQFRHCEPTGRANARPMTGSAKKPVAGTSRHTPRKRSIQYAAASRFHHRRLGILDHPLSRMMTTESVACSRSLNALPPSRRAKAPELYENHPPKIRGRRESRVPAAPAAPRAKCRKHASASPQVHREHPAFPARWFYGLFRALPGDRLSNAHIFVAEAVGN